MTLGDYLAARPVSTPLGLFDCDVPVGGSIPIVVSAADHEPDCPNPPARVAAMGGSPGRGGWVNRTDFPQMSSVGAGQEMLGRTALAPEDMDIARRSQAMSCLPAASPRA